MVLKMNIRPPTKEKSFDGRTWIDEECSYDYGGRSVTKMESLHTITYNGNNEKPDKPVS